ncbi:hypothetical protein [Pedobacter gandavensis]|uniref:hypothetical protein n=1 Tax=Pedobacter gandavensis TaxID=2679963 RepID=UPI00292EC2D9|nr:hypothetical protein [Pedobacter gandavensis]
MLAQFTWAQFLVAAAVLTLVWYCLVILLFYRKELKSFLNGKPTQSKAIEPLPHHWDQQVDQFEQEAEDYLMGKSKMPEGVSVISAEEIGFADAKPQQLGLVADVLEEIKTIFGILVKEDGNKYDFVNLMQSVRESYPKIASHPNLDQINDFIISNASFHITREELDTLWY